MPGSALRALRVPPLFACFAIDEFFALVPLLFHLFFLLVSVGFLFSLLLVDITRSLLQSAFEVFEKERMLHRALSDEHVSENLNFAIGHKNLQDAELQKHLLRSAATLDTFPGGPKKEHIFDHHQCHALKQYPHYRCRS